MLCFIIIIIIIMQMSDWVRYVIIGVVIVGLGLYKIYFGSAKSVKPSSPLQKNKFVRNSLGTARAHQRGAAGAGTGTAIGIGAQGPQVRSVYSSDTRSAAESDDDDAAEHSAGAMAMHSSASSSSSSSSSSNRSALEKELQR